MDKLYENLLEDVRKCLEDPVYDIIQNFSLKKSELYYDKRAKQRNAGDYKYNLADKKENISFAFDNLSELSNISAQAHNLYVGIKKEKFFRGAEWYIYGQNVVVEWHRLKTFDEWLHDGLKDALLMAYSTPEDGVRRILERVLGEGVYTNTAIHLFAEGKIDIETLTRLGKYEKYRPIYGRDVEEDIRQSKKALEDIKTSETIDEICEMLKRRDVTVLKLKK